MVLFPLQSLVGLSHGCRCWHVFNVIEMEGQDRTSESWLKFYVKGVKAPNLFILYKYIYIYKYIERKSQRYIYMYVAVVLLSLSANSDGHETPKHILPFVSMHCVLTVAGCL